PAQNRVLASNHGAPWGARRIRRSSGASRIPALLMTRSPHHGRSRSEEGPRRSQEGPRSLARRSVVVDREQRQVSEGDGSERGRGREGRRERGQSQAHGGSRGDGREAA